MNVNPWLWLVLLTLPQGASCAALDLAPSAHAKVAQFLAWERQIKPSGIYQAYLGGALPTLLSEELICLLNAASGAREIAMAQAPDEKPPFVEGNPFLPNGWDPLLGAEILSSRAVAGSLDRSEVRVRFAFGELGSAASAIYHDTSTYLVAAGPHGARIMDIDAGGRCDFCQSGSLRTALYDTLAAYPSSGYQQCQGLAK